MSLFDQVHNMLSDPLAKQKARDTLAKLEGLTMHPGWQLVQEELRNQYEARRNARDFVDPNTMDAGTPFRTLFLSGEIAGMGLCLELPTQLAEQARAFVENMIDEENDNGTD